VALAEQLRSPVDQVTLLGTCPQVDGGVTHESRPSDMRRRYALLTVAQIGSQHTTFAGNCGEATRTATRTRRYRESPALAAVGLRAPALGQERPRSVVLGTEALRGGCNVRALVW
jgi:hypothetical protein